jgi:hypothetical protein
VKSLRTAAALAAIAALPALAGPTPRAMGPFGDDFASSLDLDDMLAEAHPAPTPPPDARQWKEYGERMREWAQDFSSELQGSLAIAFSDRVGHGRLVKGAPYSAEAVSETRQTLGDGNVISHEDRSRVFRDGEGRTRQEMYRRGELRSIYINDPVAHASYTLLPRSKVAVKIARDSRTPRGSGDPASGGDLRVEKTTRTIVIDKDAQPGTREEVRVRVMRGDDDRDLPAPPAPPLTPPPPLPPGTWESLPMPAPFPGELSMRFQSPPDAADHATKKLGTKEIEGVKAEGVSTVWTIPAGQIGNRNPINITRETWTSPELQVTVYSRYSDPRSGESIYRLAAVKRTEPSPDLFKVPEGYKVREGHGITPAPPVPPVPPVPGVHPAPPAPPTPPPPRG